jgi:hypothetical protein
MIGDLQAVLPATSFVPFQCSRLVRPHVLWKNPDRAMDVDLSEHAYCIPLPHEPLSAYAPETRTYYAERYGSEGSGLNGGGGRCGLIGSVQIKGIGATPVVGAKSDFWHSHGAAALAEGIREALWGEVCNVSLPHGAARVHGLIATGTTCPYDHAQEGHGTAERILILRQSTLRPAHYMRAIGFVPKGQGFDGQATDTVRTRMAVASFAAAFRTQSTLFDGSNAEAINDGLVNMVVRIAEQLSSARAKRIMHGALSCSNICIDGSYVDFGTITTLSDYGRIIVARHFPDLWKQASTLMKALGDLMFYLKKYLPPNESRQLISNDCLANLLYFKLDQRLAVEYVKLVGVPTQWVTHVEAATIRALYDCFQSIVASGNREPFKLSPDHVSTMPDPMGAYSLNRLIRCASVCASQQAMNALLKPQLLDARLREQFCKAVWEVRESVVVRIEEKEKPWARFLILLNALRLNSPFSELYRPNLDKTIAEAGACPSEIERLIYKMIRQAKSLLSDASGLDVDLSGVVSPGFDRSTHVMRCASGLHSRSDVLRVFDDWDTNRLTPDELGRARCYAAELFGSV